MNFFRGIPKALKEQASIDGVGALGLLFKIYVPAVSSRYCYGHAFQRGEHWNNFFDGMLLLNSPKRSPADVYSVSGGAYFGSLSKQSDGGTAHGKNVSKDV